MEPLFFNDEIIENETLHGDVVIFGERVIIKNCTINGSLHISSSAKECLIEGNILVGVK